MAARALLPHSDKGVEVNLKKANVEWKSKNIIPVEGRNRRALGDIGNIVAAADVKPHHHHALRPAFRSLNVGIDGDHVTKNKKPTIVAAINCNPKKKHIESDRREAAITSSPFDADSEEIGASACRNRGDAYRV